jgi:acyl carrier protein
LAAKSLKDFGLDSLDVVEMCLDLEDKYGIEFSPEELAEFKTVGDLLASIEKKLAK